MWTVISSDEGVLTICQSSPTYRSAKLYRGSDVSGRTSVNINWLFPNASGTGDYVATSTSWTQVWSAANISVPLPNGGDACTVIGLPVRRLEFNQTEQTRQTGHVNLVRHRVLHLCSRDLPQCSLSPHGRTDVVTSLIVVGSAPDSLIHNGFATPRTMYCANPRQLRHMSFQIRDQADEVVQLPHSVHFELVVTRPYE